MTPLTAKGIISHFPSHAEPRVWFITDAVSPVGVSIAREVLAHGDIVVAGHDTVNASKEDPSRLHELDLLHEDAQIHGWRDRLQVVNFKSRCEAPFSLKNILRAVVRTDQ